MKLKGLKVDFFVCAIIFSVACSSERVKEANPGVATEQVSIFSKNTSAADKPQALNPEPRNKRGDPPTILMATSGMDAIGVAVLVGTVIGLSRVFRTKDERTDLNGTCIYGEPESPMISPCINVGVNLLDSELKVIVSASTNQNGDFRFYIPSGKSYYVQVIDRKGRASTTKASVGRSEFISLFLKP